MPPRKWTEEEDALLREAFSHDPPKYEMIPGRTRKACEVRASRMGWRNSPRYNFWTDEELEELDRVYETWPRDFSGLAHHSLPSIYTMAAKRGLTGKPLPPQFEHVTAEQWGYMAALIDGEGTIRRMAPDGRRRIKTPRWELSVANTFMPLADWLSEVFPGGCYSLHERSKQEGKEHWKDCFSMRWTHQEVLREILRGMLPYMVIKKGRAQQALDELAEYVDGRSATRAS